MTEVQRYSALCPLQVERPIMYHRWEAVTFLHWAYDPDVVQRLLPKSLTVETFDGAAWVGLVPFFMRINAPGIPRLPWLSHFCEANVRTYARDERGNSGVWFFSLDAARLPAVVAARLGFRLPYMWSRMHMQQDGTVVTYAAVRRWPTPVTNSRVRIEIGPRFEAHELTDRDHFLTARWRLFSVGGRRQRWRRFANARHEPWPLHHAAVQVLDDHFVEAAGLPKPTAPALAHYSPGVDVKISRPYRYIPA